MWSYSWMILFEGLFRMFWSGVTGALRDAWYAGSQ